MKVSVFIMGRKTTQVKTSQSKTTDTATAHFKGTVVSFYGDGRKYDYITIDVQHGYDEYYDRFKIAVNKNYEVPDDGEPIEIDCTIKCYKGDVTFKEVNADDPN